MLLITYFIFFHLTLLIPAYGFISLIKQTNGLLWLKLCLAYMTSLVTCLLLALSTYALYIPHRVAFVTHLVLIILGSYIFVRKGLFRELWRERFVLFALLLMSGLACAVIGLSLNSKPIFIPDPQSQANRNYQVASVKILNLAHTQANDNYLPYRQAQFIFNRSNPVTDSFLSEWGVTFFQRTPLMGAVTAQYFILLRDQPPVDYTWSTNASDPGNTYLKFQILAAILNSLLIIPAFYLLRLLFSDATASVSSLFLITSQFFLFNSFFSWPKSLIAFFILFTWLLLLEKKGGYILLAALASAAAYLTHDLAVLYIGTSVLLLLYQRRLKELVVFSIATSILMLPWILVSSLVFKRPSSFYLYPFSVNGIPQSSQQHEVINAFLHTSPLRLIRIRLESLFYLISPYQLLFLDAPQSFLRRMWAFGIFSIPGAIGVGLLPSLVWGIIKRMGGTAFWILALAPIVMCVTFIGWPKGLGALHFAQAVIILFTGLGVNVLLSSRSRVWALTAYTLSSLQLIFLILYSYDFRALIWFGNLGDILRLGLIVAIIVFCGWQIFIRTGKVASARSAH